MNDAQLAVVIEAAVEKAMEASRKEFWIQAEQHYQDHMQIKFCREHQEKWRRNHEFVEEIRSAGDTMKKVAWVTVATGILGLAWWAIREAIKHTLER